MLAVQEYWAIWPVSSYVARSMLSRKTKQNLLMYARAQGDRFGERRKMTTPNSSVSVDQEYLDAIGREYSSGTLAFEVHM